MTPDQLAIYNQMIGAGSGALPNANTVNSSGTGAVASGTTGAEGALSGLLGFDPTASNNVGSVLNTANQYVNGLDIPGQVKAAMQSANEEARDVTNPMIDNSAAGTGNINSSRTDIAHGIVDRALAEQAGNLESTLRNSAFDTGTSLGENMASTNNANKLSAMDAALSGGTGLSYAGNSAATGGLDNIIQSLGLSEQGATGAQQNNQLGLTNQLQQYEAGTQAPFTPLQNLMSIIGTANWGSNSSGSSTTTSTPSALQVIGGAMNSLGSLVGSPGIGSGPLAGYGASGLLGMSGTNGILSSLLMPAGFLTGL